MQERHDTTEVEINGEIKRLLPHQIDRFREAISVGGSDLEAFQYACDPLIGMTEDSVNWLPTADTLAPLIARLAGMTASDLAKVITIIKLIHFDGCDCMMCAATARAKEQGR